MSLSLILTTAALALSSPQTLSPAPEMRVAIADLDFGRPADKNEFVRRVRVASRDYCRAHAEVVTPDRLGNVTICQSGMRWMAYRALPDAQRQHFAQASRMPAIR